MQNGSTPHSAERPTLQPVMTMQPDYTQPRTAKVTKLKEPPKTDIGAILGGLVFVLLLIGLAIFGLWAVFTARADAQKQLDSNTKVMAETTVLATKPEIGSAEVHLSLPGSVSALRETPVYARVSGYLKDWKVDIGTKVTANQLLAEIDTPETDQQLMQAQAQEAQAQANLTLSQSNANRYNELLLRNAVAQQDADNANADLAVKKADLQAAQAGVGRLQQIESFKQVYAPFEGVITSRGVEVGNLINAGAGTPTQELFRLAQISTLRVFVNVPEAYSPLMLPGIKARIEFSSQPNDPIEGVLARTAGEINANSQTLLVELDVPNDSQKLLPGGYAQVHFDLTNPHPPLVIPGNCLIFRAAGAQLAVADPVANVVHLKAVKLGRDFGTKVEVADGITADDLVVINPPDSLFDGKAVSIKVNTPSPSPAPTK